MSIRAGFVSSSPEWHWERQFPNEIPVWEDVHFIFSGSFAECDVLFVFDALPLDRAGLQAKRSVFIASEPASIKRYNSSFLAQFDKVLTTDSLTDHKNVELGQIGSPWHIGAWNESGKLLPDPMNYNTFETFRPKKTKSISVVASNKAYTEGHRTRLAFVDSLKKYFGAEIDVFGRKINGFGDKTHVLNEYRYHIAIENSCYNHYWTEKLSDPYLSLTYPIYYGCENIHEYFSEDSLTRVNINDTEAAVNAIRKLIDSDIAERKIPDLLEARRKVLRENNLFSILADLAKLALATPVRLRGLECERFYLQPKYRWKRKFMRPFASLSGIA